MSEIVLTDKTKLVVKTLEPVMLKAEDDQPIVAVVSTDSEDSDGDVIHQAASDKGGGWDLAHFNGRPLVLWSHDRYSPNLAAPGTKAFVQPHGGRDALHLATVFDLPDPAAAFLDGKVRRGVPLEWSVGVRYRKYEDRDTGRGLEVFEQDLIEVSLCNRGANPDTAVLAKSILRNRPDLVSMVDDGGSREVAELKDEIVALSERLRASEGLLAKIGDKLAEYDQLEAWIGKERDRREVALRELSSALQRMK